MEEVLAEAISPLERGGTTLVLHAASRTHLLEDWRHVCFALSNYLVAGGSGRLFEGGDAHGGHVRTGLGDGVLEGVL